MDFAQYNFNPFQFTPGEDLLLDAHARHVAFFAGCRQVLDLGAGRGLFLRELAKQSINGIGVENHPPSMEEGRRHGVRYHEADMFDFFARADGQISGRTVRWSLLLLCPRTSRSGRSLPVAASDKNALRSPRPLPLHYPQPRGHRRPRILSLQRSHSQATLCALSRRRDGPEPGLRAHGMGHLSGDKIRLARFNAPPTRSFPLGEAQVAAKFLS